MNNRRRNFRTRSQKNNFRRRNGSLNQNNSNNFSNNGNVGFNRNGSSNNIHSVEKAMHKFQNWQKMLKVMEIQFWHKIIFSIRSFLKKI